MWKDEKIQQVELYASIVDAVKYCRKRNIIHGIYHDYFYCDFFQKKRKN